MAIGDFVAVQSTLRRSLADQIRTDGFAGATSITTGLAAMVGNVRVSFANGRAVEVDGAPDGGLQIGGVQTFGEGSLGAAFRQRLSTALEQRPLGHGHRPGRLPRLDGRARIARWPRIGEGPAGQPTAVRIPDFLLPDGTSLGRPGADVILGVFADAWRVTQGASLLDDLPHPATLVQAMAANLVPSAPVYQGQPPVDANAQGIARSLAASQLAVELLAQELQLQPFRFALRARPGRRPAARVLAAKRRGIAADRGRDRPAPACRPAISACRASIFFGSSASARSRL